MGVHLKERGHIAVAVESTKGTANPPLVGDAGIEVYDPSLEPVIEIADRNPLEPSFGRRRNITGNQMRRLTLRVPLSGSGTAGTAATWGRLLRACATTETIVPATSVTYAPVTAFASQDTVTIDVYRGEKRWRLVGVMGNPKFIISQNEVPVVEFTFMGIYVAAADSAPLAPSFPSVNPPSPVSVTLTWNAITLIATSLEIDLANDVQMRQDIGQATGYRHAVIVERDPSATADAEEEAVSTVDWEEQVRLATAGALSIVISGGAGNIHTFSAPVVQIVAAPLVERNGLLVRNLQFKLRRSASAGNDELSYVQT
jgi:hypothetical protein